MWEDDPEVARIFRLCVDGLKHTVIPKTEKRAEQHVYEITPFRRWLAYQEHLLPQEKWLEAHGWMRLVCHAANDAVKGVTPEREGKKRGALGRLTPEQVKKRRERSARGN